MIEYLNLGLFILIAIFISCIIIILPYFIRNFFFINNNDLKNQVKIDKTAKFESYECGLPQINNPNANFDIKFYLFAILFVIFDIEIMFLLPFAINLKKLSLFAFCSVILFLNVLFIGFIYEKKSGALDL